MSKLSISLFNVFQMECEGQIVNTFTTHKVQDLFCYLILNRNRPHVRELLAAQLWQDQPVPSAKKYLRKALWQLQNTLNSFPSSANNNFLLIEADRIQFNNNAQYWLDIEEFEHVYHLVKGKPGSFFNDIEVEAMHKAVRLYRGDLLVNCFEDWNLFERERLQFMYLSILDKLMQYCELHQQYESGVDYGATILRYDEVREHTHRRLMRLYYFAGNRTAALRQYNQCQEILRFELNVAPSKKTTHLHQAIQADQLEHTTFVSMHKNDQSSKNSRSLSRLITHLKSLHLAIGNIHSEIEKEIESVEAVLSQQQK